MLDQVAPRSQLGNEYTKLLLRERRRELRSLARRYAQQQITQGEYQGCRESLLQAIAELINIERSSWQSNAARQNNCDVSN